MAERAGIEVRVRRATPRDLEGYARVVQSVAAEGRYLFIERVTEKKRRSMAELLKDRACLVLAAEARERGRWKMVGSLALSRYGDASKSGHVRVLAMMVVDGYRGMGIGKRLMEEGLEWARAAEGVEKVALGVFSNNGRAYRLYESFGFKVEGVRRRHYYIMGKPEDEVDMALFVK
ncbi:MAG: GNAT family N-acetyltransferase [Nitrososphaerota archaeon]|nr:GNAT family N-acetyltransferase [Nitrososphaerota archaeon]MDG6978236.1 GNAT family N-acetyltransferase [Nitrososphaerota archaeon]MDG6981516.1 GNAT family N-acetyltransferase [Nitrososphaerota archaeon]MDG7021858.1 GNAT family N-acetyltransferase [Nitrososphaerota archaeon]